MKLVIVCRVADGFGGTTRTIYEHARRLAARGWSVDILAERLDAEAARRAGARPRRLLGWPWGGSLKRRLFAWRADRLAGGYDLVHGHGDHFRQDVLSLHNCVHAAHEAVHGRPLPAGSPTGALHEDILRGRRFRALIANSRLMADDVARRFGVPPEMIRVIHPGYDAERFNLSGRERLRARTRAELGVSEGEVLAGLITSGDFVKRGVERFLRALAAARRRRPELRGLIVGGESRLGPYRRLAGELGLGESARFLPPRREVEALYHALDLYAHPAAWEEFGQSLQEAMACGIAALAGPRVGAAELLPDGAELCRLATDDPAEWAERLALLAEDREGRERLAALGARAAARNDWDRNFAATWSVYEGLLAASGGRGFGEKS